MTAFTSAFHIILSMFFVPFFKHFNIVVCTSNISRHVYIHQMILYFGFVMMTGYIVLVHQLIIQSKLSYFIRIYSNLKPECHECIFQRNDKRLV
jgi:hypothetical protein